jgi:hypothetical protein
MFGRAALVGVQTADQQRGSAKGAPDLECSAWALLAHDSGDDAEVVDRRNR